MSPISDKIVEVTRSSRIIDVTEEGIQGARGPAASSNRIIVSATAPTTREDGSPLQENDVWIDVS